MMQIRMYTSSLGYLIGTRGERRCTVAVQSNNSPNMQQNICLKDLIYTRVINIFAGSSTVGGSHNRLTLSSLWARAFSQCMSKGLSPLVMGKGIASGWWGGGGGHELQFCLGFLNFHTRGFKNLNK